MGTDPAPSLDALRRGDPAAWRITYRGQWKRAWTAAAKYLRDPRDREEVASHALQQLHTQLANLENMAHLDAMVIVLAQRRAISLLRELTAHKRADVSPTSLDDLTGGIEAARLAPAHPLLPPDHGSPAEAATRRLDLQDLLAQLPPSDRQLLHAYFVEDRSSAEIAATTGTNANTLRSRVLRLLADLRDRFEPRQP